jgi:hypothetical protein
MQKLHSMYLNSVQRSLKANSRRSRPCGLYSTASEATANEIVDCLSSIRQLSRLHLEMIQRAF